MPKYTPEQWTPFMGRRTPDLKLDFAGSGLTPKAAEEYGRASEAAWTLYQIHPKLGEVKHSEVYLRRDELLREYESFGSYPMVARPQ